MAVLEGLGAIAGNFAQGYRQAREQKTQQSLQQQQLDYEHANRLFQMADQVQDPHMKDTLFTSATRLLEQLESPTKTKSNPKGIGSIFGSMFGIGHQKPTQTPAPGVASQPLGPEKPPASPEAASPGSQTFGSLSDMFGQTLQAAKPAAPAESPAGPQIPQVPQVDTSGVPPTRELQAAATPFQPPALSSPKGTPVAPPVAAVPPAPAAVAARHPESGKPLNIPAPIDIQQRAMKETQSPQYGFRDPVRQKMAEQQYASQIMQTLLQVTEQHLAQNPHIRTLAAADNDPDFGPEFRQIMDAVGRYEAAGQLEKGTLENWMKQRFDDVRFGSVQHNPNAEPPTIADAFGNRWTKGPDGQYSVPALPAAQTKGPEPRTFDQQVDLAFSIAPQSRGTSEWNTIKGYFEKMAGTDRAKLSPRDQVQWDWLKAHELDPIDKKAAAFQSLFNPVQPGQPIILNSQDPNSNRVTPSLLNRGTGQVTPIPGAQEPGEAFNAEKYMRKYQGPAVVNAAGRPETPQPVLLYDPDQLIGSHHAGDKAVSVDQLRKLLLDPSQFPPGGAKKVEDYINSLPGPYPTLGQKK